MLATWKCRTECCYLSSLLSLEEFAVLGKCLAYDSDRRTGIKKRPNFKGVRKFKTGLAPFINNVL